ncbi:MAG: T9SS type A sorting domain-containing protein [Bacteroidetes bacterium]|nr:T9SS type A sorting domain-containing protein [Bacteroidota bacterium]
MRIKSLTLIVGLMLFNLSTLWSQSNPTAQSLPYSQDFASFTGTTTIYPAGIQGWTISGSTSTSFPTAAPNGNQALAAGTNGSTSAGVFDMNGKIGMLNTGSALRSIALSINTTGLTSINVSFVAATQRQVSTERIGAIGLQYRIGTSGSFTNVSGSEYQNPGGSDNTSGTGSLSPQTISVTLPAACNNQAEVQLRWVYREISGSGGRPSFSLDDISISGTPASSPSITVTPNSLTGFSYVVGSGPSAEQSFSISGSNLTAAITITPPANYEISTGTGAGFVATNPILLNHSGGTVASTDIYVRLKAGLAVGNYNGENITASSTGADNKTVSLNGSVTNPPSPTITITPTQLFGFQYYKGAGPSDMQSVLLSCSDLTGNLSITPPAGFEISATAAPFTPENPLILTPTAGAVGGVLWIRMKEGLGAGIYQQTFAASSPGASSVDINVSGAVLNEAFTTWNFTGTFTAASPETTSGTGTASVVGSMTGPGSATGTTTGCAQTSGNAWAIGTAAPGASNESSGVQFMVPTTGRENIWFAYDHRLSNTATRTARIQYTLNGTDWINLDVDNTNYLSQCLNRGGIDNGRIDASNPVGSNVSDSWGRRVINFSGISGANNNPNFGVRILAAHYANTGEFRQANNVNAVATGGTWRFDNVVFGGDLILGGVATKLAVSPVNNGNNPTQNVPFTVTVQALDNSNVPTNVTTDTQVTLSLATGTGNLGGTLTATIATGENSVTFNNVTYNTAEAGVSITATATSGMTLSPATSATFTVLAPASQLALIGVPANGQVNTNLASFTVEARRPDNSVDGSFTGNITIAKATGPGAISGTLTKAAVNGVATFNDIQFDQAGTYTIEATATGLSSATSGNILITNAPTLTEVLLPQYIQGINGTNNDRIMYAYRATLSNLLPNSTYRYINQIVDGTDGPTAGGAGNVIFVNSSGTFTRTTSPSLATAGAYGEFTTDANGVFTGWFVNEPTGNVRFTPGNNVQMRIRLNNGAGGTTAVTYLTTTNTVKVLNFGTTSGSATQGTALRAESNFMPGNFAFLYDNTSGTGRPLYGTPIEITGLDYSATTWAAFFRNNVVGDDGAFAAIIPNQNANGVKLIQQRNFADGAVAGSFSSNNGQWGTANTVNPSGGTSNVIVIDLKQGPAIAVSPTSLSGFGYTAGQGPSATQSFVVSGTNLVGAVGIDAPPSYELSLTNAPNFDPYTQIFLSPTGTTLNPTTVYVRLKAGLAAGNYNETILMGSPSADPRSVTLQGTVNPGILEPENHVTNFAANALNSSQINVSWTDAVPTASGYLIKGSTTGFGDIAAPADGVAETNSTLVRNVAAGVQSFTFEGLNSSTTYYFKIFPYNGSGSSINYKTDGAVPQASATTPAGPVMTEILLPQYIQGVNGTNNTRLPYAFRVSFSNLNPNTTYRFINQAVNNTDGATSGGAGNPIYVMPNGDFVRTTSPGFSVAGQYGEFTTDADGNYTGWFMLEPTGNARFTPGQEVAMRIRLNNGAGGTTAVHYFTTQNVTVINFGTAANAAQGTALRANSNFAPKNFVFLYTSVRNTNRPVAGTHIEPSGIDFAGNTSYPGYYRNDVAGLPGAFGTILPNMLPGGINLISEYSLSNGQLLGSLSSNDGMWGSTNTVNPTGGLNNVLVINLDFTPNFTLTPTALSGFSYVEGQGPSAPQSFTVSGTNLSGPVQLTAPAAYELSLTGGSGFSGQASLSLNHTGGTVANTTVYIRLKQGLAAGTYNQQLTATSAGADNKTLALQGSVIPPAAEPPAHASMFQVAVNTQTQLTATWFDAVPNAQFYLIKGSTEGFAAIVPPMDGQPEADGLLVRNIPAGQQQAVFTGMNPETTYYFKLYPYNGTGATVNYKTDGMVPQASRATLGTPSMTALVLPQYIQGVNGTNNNRLPYAFRLRLQNLKPNSTYRYTNQAVSAADGPTVAGAGNPVYVNGNNFFRTSSPGFAVAGQYGEFTTDANGSYSGWFMIEPTGNARFTPGQEVMMRLRLNDGEGGTAPVTYFTTDAVKVIDFGTAADAASGTGVRATSNASPRNFAFVYDNAAGAGRPLYGTSIETTGLDFSATSYPNFYRDNVAGTNGAWGGIVPNLNPQGIRRVEERSLVTGQVVNSLSSADGFWGSVNTANPNGGLANIIVLDLAGGTGQEKLSGQLKYFNANETIIPSPNAHGVFYAQLFENGIAVRPRQLISHNLELNLPSYFEFGNLEAGKTYTLRIWEQTPSTLLGNSWTFNQWGGASAVDAVIISYVGTNNPLIAQYPWILPAAGQDVTPFGNYIADVNNSGDITGSDALILAYRLVGQPGTSPFPGGKPNFLLSASKVASHEAKTYPAAPELLFSTTGSYAAGSQAASVYYEATLPALSPGNNIYNVYFTAVGDMNASYFDQNAALKNRPAIRNATSDQPELSIYADNNFSLKAFRIEIELGKGLNISQVDGADVWNYDEASGMLRAFGMFNQERLFRAGDKLVSLRTDITGLPAQPHVRTIELVDAQLGQLKDAALVLYSPAPAKVSVLQASVWPNPAHEMAQLELNLPEDGLLSIMVTDQLGRVVWTNTQQAAGGVFRTSLNAALTGAPGLYHIRVHLQGKQLHTVHTKLIVK